MPENSTSTKPAEGIAADPLDLAHLAPGERWQGVYVVGEMLPDQTMGRSFRAVHAQKNLEVEIRSFRCNDSHRAEVWELLKLTPGIVECFDAFEAEGRRVEVTAVPPPKTLKEWCKGRSAGAIEIKLALSELASVIATLQERDVVHLNLRPEKIHVASEVGGLQLLVGGLEAATTCEQSGLITAVVNPFYAPPEAVGLYQHSPGRTLKAWDWWSLGRVMQEMCLGQHILGHILERDVSRQTPELNARAESLLSDSDESGLRAGGVEAMPAIDKDLQVALRGLLTSCRDARWGAAEFHRWLAGEPVHDRYCLARNERLFVWKDQAMTLPDAAVFFGQAQNWKDGILNLFDAADSRTLMHFLHEMPSLTKVKEKLEAFIKMKDSMALSSLPFEVKQDLIACIAWGHLAAGAAKPRLFGREFGPDCIREVISDEMLPRGLLYLKGLLARAFLQHIEQQDKEGARFLSEFDKAAQAAVTLAKTNSWIVEENHAEVAKIMRNCLEKDTTLRAEVDLMKVKYACTRMAVLDRIFKKAAPSKSELAVLVFTHHDPQRFDYVSHAEWNSEHYRSLLARGDRMATAVRWMNLAAAFRRGPLAFGGWKLNLAIWAVLAVLVGVTRQSIMLVYLVAAPACFIWGLRCLWYRLNRKGLVAKLKEGESWRFFDGSDRCLELTLQALDVASPPAIKDLRANLEEVNLEITKLPIEPKPEAIPVPRRSLGALAISYSSWLIVAASLTGTGWTLWNHPPKFAKSVASAVVKKTPEKPDLRKAKERSGPGSGKSGYKEKPAEPPEPSGIDYEVQTDEDAIRAEQELQKAVSHLEKLRAEEDKLPKPPPKIAWSFRRKTPQIVDIRGSEEASASQLAAGSRLANMTLSRFEPSTIDTLVAIRVPVSKGVGIMLWDPKAGRFTSSTVIKMNYVPLARTWLDVSGAVVFYLGTM